MESLPQIKSQISHWNQIKDTPEAFKLLTAGYGFTISKSNFLAWEPKNPESLHVYLAEEENKLVFYLTDSVTDADEMYDINETLVKKEFYRVFTNNADSGTNFNQQPAIDGTTIEKTLAQGRITDWILKNDSWFRAKTTTEGKEILRAFQVPFSDLVTLFKQFDNDIIAVFALKNFTQNEQTFLDAELILGRTQPLSSTVELLADVTIPHPPFPITGNFNLFSQ